MAKREGKTPLGKPKHIWKVDIKMNPKERGWGGMDWTDLAQERDKKWLWYTQSLRDWMM
jgi:hypothetical protein